MRKIRMDEVCSFVSGYAWNSNDFNFMGNGLPIIRIQNIPYAPDDEFAYWSKGYNDKFIVSYGDLIVSLSGSIKVDIWKGPVSLLNQRIVKIECDPNLINKKYAFIVISNLLKEIEMKGNSSIINNVSINVLKELQIDVPTIEDQVEIVQILDKAQALIDKRKQAIAKLDELVQAVFLDMFGDPTINQMGYPIGIIRDLIIEAKYGTSKKANEGTGQFPYLRMNNITYQGYMDYSNLKYIDLDDKEQEKYLVQRGDLLFNRTNSKELVGKTAVFDSDEKMAIAGYIVRVKTNDAGNPYFISGYLNSKHGKKVLQEMCKNIIGMANINAQELQNIAILIPPRELQDSYERKFKAILEEKKKHLTQLQHLESNFQALLQKAFKGELKVKDGVEV